MSCSETKEIDPEALGYNYYPLQTGLYSIYEVHGVEYLNEKDSIVFDYQLKEAVVDSFQNLETGISYKIERQKRSDENDAWDTDSIWTVRKDDIRVIRTENNVPIINLVFPPGENITWDAMGFSDQETDEFEMVSVGQQYEEYGQTLTVIQEELPDRIVMFISKKEIYSMDVGLVYKENIILKYKQGDDIGLEIVDSGIRYFQSLIEYGEE